MESLKKARNEAPFQFSKRMQRMRVSHPNDALLSENSTSDNHDATDDLEGNIEWFELNGETEEDVQMFNLANLGGIGEEDEADGKSFDVLLTFKGKWRQGLYILIRCSS
jgi:hypothetical protein